MAEDFGVISPFYSTADDGSFPRSPVPEEEEKESAASLVTVHSPTPSLPTIVSPSSANSHVGKGYLEVYKIAMMKGDKKMRHIDESGSPSTVLSMESSSPSPEVEGDLSLPSVHSTPPPTVKEVKKGKKDSQQIPAQQPLQPTISSLAAAAGLPFITSPLLDSAALAMTHYSPSRNAVRYSFKPYPTLREQQKMFSGRSERDSFLPSVVPASGEREPVLPTHRLPPHQAIISRPSFRLHQKPVQPLSRIASFKRRHSIRSTAASHGCKG